MERVRTIKPNLCKRYLLFVLAFVFAIGLQNPTLAASSDAMSIQAIWLGETTTTGKDNSDQEPGGDAVLLESGGNYLLMDTGALSSADYVVNALKKRGVKTLSVYISHTHDDHRGALPAIYKNFQVKTLYLPSKQYGVEYPLHGEIYDNLYDDAAEEGAVVKELKVGSSFAMGQAKVSIIGPVGTFHLSSFEDSDGVSGDQSGHYLNNYSLVAMVTCGTTKYLTAGDIEKEEEKALLKQYGTAGLKADIYKMSHHGLGSTSNTESFVGAVKPTYGFALNSAFTALVVVKDENGDTKGKFRKTYTSRKNVSQYGLPYMVGDEKKDLLITVRGGAVKLYRGTETTTNQLKGWVTVQGADGAIEKTDKYYLNAAGVPLKGVRKIDGKYYYLGTGGCMEKGYYDDGAYVCWRSYGSKHRYFLQTGEMYAGFRKINGNLFYFSTQTGYRKVGSKSWPLVNIGGKTYTMNENGAIYTGGWKKDTKTGNCRYFGSSGAMLAGWLTVSGSKYYLDAETGLRTLGLKKIDGKFYYFNGSGKLQKSKTVKIDGVSYKASTNGVIAPPKVSKGTLSKAKASGTAAKLTWKAVSKAKGYSVEWATNSGFTQGKKSLTVKGGTATGTTISGLASGSTYYVRVRAYKKLGSYKIYGKYSAVKQVTIP